MPSRHQRSSRLLLVPFCSLLLLPGCQKTLSIEERGKIAGAYAEMMIAKNIIAGDSATIARGVDSVLKLHGYENEEALMQEMKNLSANPDHLREVMDSTQHLLERAQRESSTRMQ